MKCLGFFIVVLNAIMFTCCEQKSINDSHETLKINPHGADENINLSEIADSVICIKLKTDSNDILGRVRNIIIRKKYIYAVDASQKAVFVFDKRGDFVAKLDKRGQGADEYVFIGPVFVDENEEFIELIDYKGGNSTKLKYSNISFELLEVIPFPDVNCNSCVRNNGFYYFLTQQHENVMDGKKTNAALVILDEKNNKKILFDKTIDTNHMNFSPTSESFTRNERNELFASFMYDNTFYRLDGNEAYPILSVGFGKYGMDNSVGLKSIEEQLTYVQKTSDLASFPVLNLETPDMMSFSYYFKSSAQPRMYREEDFRQYIKLKKENKVYHCKKIKNDITGFPDHVYLSSYFFNCVHEVFYEHYLVDIVIPEYYFRNSEEEKIIVDDIGEVTADDNPIIVMMKLKK